eukprot:COSAG02_NODE_528_length_20698_cov_6.231710_6_plen_104_part_00
MTAEADYVRLERLLDLDKAETWTSRTNFQANAIPDREGQLLTLEVSHVVVHRPCIDVELLGQVILHRSSFTSLLSWKASTIGKHTYTHTHAHRLAGARAARRH